MNDLIKHIEKELNTKDVISEIDIADQIEKLDAFEVGDKMYLHSIQGSLDDHDPEYPMDDSARIENAGEDLKYYIQSLGIEN